VFFSIDACTRIRSDSSVIVVEGRGLG
jgi:hypothetical protein